MAYFTCLLGDNFISLHKPTFLRREGGGGGGLGDNFISLHKPTFMGGGGGVLHNVQFIHVPDCELNNISLTIFKVN